MPNFLIKQTPLIVDFERFMEGTKLVSFTIYDF